MQSNKKLVIYFLTVARSKLTSHWPLLLLLSTFFILHLPFITSPPLDQHAWRQADTAAVIRNFATQSPNILFPRIDMSNQFSGITGMEFPLYNYSVFIFNQLFGFAHWHGRVVTVLFSMIGLAYFWGLARRRYSSSVAYLATVSLAAMPLWFFFSRNIQPDILMASLCIASLYYTQTYTATKNRKHIYLAMAALSLAALVKVPAVFVGLPLVYILGIKRCRELLTVKMVLFSLAVVVLPIALWYWWSGYLSSHYGLGQYFYGELRFKDSEALFKTKAFWGVIKLYILEFKASTAFIYLGIMFGLIYGWVKRDFFPVVWATAIVLFLGIFANKSYYHNYYSIPIIPPLVLLAALGINKLYRLLHKESRLIATSLVVLYVLSLGWYCLHTIKPFYVITTPELTVLESVIDGVSKKDDRIITNFGGTPIMLYFANRRGWSLTDDQIMTINLSPYKTLGAKYVVRYMPALGNVPQKPLKGATLITNTSDFLVYKLD